MRSCVIEEGSCESGVHRVARESAQNSRTQRLTREKSVYVWEGLFMATSPQEAPLVV